MEHDKTIPEQSREHKLRDNSKDTKPKNPPDKGNNTGSPVNDSTWYEGLPLNDSDRHDSKLSIEEQGGSEKISFSEEIDKIKGLEEILRNKPICYGFLYKSFGVQGPIQVYRYYLPSANNEDDVEQLLYDVRNQEQHLYHGELVAFLEDPGPNQDHYKVTIDIGEWTTVTVAVNDDTKCNCWIPGSKENRFPEEKFNKVLKQDRNFRLQMQNPPQLEFQLVCKKCQSLRTATTFVVNVTSTDNSGKVTSLSKRTYPVCFYNSTMETIKFPSTHIISLEKHQYIVECKRDVIRNKLEHAATDEIIQELAKCTIVAPTSKDRVGELIFNLQHSKDEQALPEFIRALQETEIASLEELAEILTREMTKDPQ